MRQHYTSLDGLRAIAITLVMLFHFYLLDFGWIGVQMFFVLSGFLITQILLSEKSESLNYFLKRFYWRRSLRIFPIYFAYLLSITAVFIFAGHPESFPQKSIFLYTYTFNWSRLLPDFTPDYFFTHLWSLSVEEQFYLVWPLIIFFLKEKWLKVFVIALTVLCPLYRFWLGSELIKISNDVEWIGEAIYWNTFSHFDAFAIGAAIPIFNLIKVIQRPLAVLINLIVFALIIGAVNYSLLTANDNLVNWSSFGYPVGGIKNGQHIWSYSILNLCFATLILILVRSSSNILSNKPMVAIGKVSYGMYVFHWPILWLFLKFTPENTFLRVVSFILYYVFVYIIAWLSFNLFEKRFLFLKDKYFYHYKLMPGKN